MNINHTNGNNGSSILTDAEFEALTGWTRADALDEAIETRRDARLYGGRRSDPVDNYDDFEAQTGWTREDAFAEAVEYRTDARLYGTRH